MGRLSAGCRWMRCFLAGQSCSADRGQRIYTHITAHNSPIRKNTRFTWKIPTLRGSPSLFFRGGFPNGLYSVLQRIRSLKRCVEACGCKIETPRYAPQFGSRLHVKRCQPLPKETPFPFFFGDPFFWNPLFSFLFVFS